MQSLKHNSFCKNCDNFMDITNNISSDNAEINEDENINNTILESSDYNVPITESTGGGISDTNINELLTGSDIDLDLPKNFNISNLNKNTEFNKLNSNEKTLVINRILENNKNKGKTNDNVVNKESYYYCKSCGYNEIILPKQFIFGRGNESNNDNLNFDIKNYIYDNTLPRTKKYNCIDSNCSTHKKPELKLAIFYRERDTYNTRYICLICNAFWNTYLKN